MTQHSDDEDEIPENKKAGEGWVVTFADMMSLLMSFFVLLLSFSEQDQAKFKEVGGSLEQAFGVQRDIVAYQVPKGTSIVAREFSPGKPKPTAMNEVKQSTVDDAEQTLEFDLKDHPEHKKKLEEQIGMGAGNADYRGAKAVAVAKRIAQALSSEIKEGKIKIITKNQRVIIRILDQGSFAPGDNSIHPAFFPMLNKVAYLLNEIPGQITVTGHTDDKPIASPLYRSNLALSASRAVTVADYLEDRGVDKQRIVVTGAADTDPLVPNDSEENRKKNRRVEISIVQEDDPHLREAPEVVPAYLRNQIKEPPREIVVNPPADKAKSQPKNNNQGKEHNPKPAKN